MKKGDVILFPIIFTLSFFLVILLLPRNALIFPYVILSIMFATTTSIFFSCIILDTIKKVRYAIKYKYSWLNIISIIIGTTALQLCGVGLYCSPPFWIFLLSGIFPTFFIHFLLENYVLIFIFAITIQIFSLYKMNCFNLFKAKQRQKNKITKQVEFDIKYEKI